MMKFLFICILFLFSCSTKIEIPKTENNYTTFTKQLKNADGTPFLWIDKKQIYRGVLKFQSVNKNFPFITNVKDLLRCDYSYELESGSRVFKSGSDIGSQNTIFLDTNGGIQFDNDNVKNIIFILEYTKINE